MEKQIGNYSFIIGVIVAVVLGLAATQLGTAAGWLGSLLVVLGLVVGFLNIHGKDTKEFLWVTVALVVVSYAGGAQIDKWQNVQVIGPYLSGIFNNILAFVIPASVIVGLRNVWDMARGE